MRATADGHGPIAYEGRPLPRQDEEVVDQGLRFDVETLLGRRHLLRIFGLGAATVGLAACGVGGGTGSTSSGSTSATAGSGSSGTGGSAAGEIPDETAGPYPADGTNGPDVLEQSGIVRSDLRSSFGTASGVAEGVAIDLELTITDLANGGAAFAGVAVYAWHCDREGRYSLYSEGVENENYLRGVQIADADGKVRFRSIFPACYSGRWPHIHFEVYPDEVSFTDAAAVIATSQVALPADVCAQVYEQEGYQSSVSNLAQVSLGSDNVFGDDAGASQLGTVTGSIDAGLVVTLAVGVDTTTTPTGGQLAGDGAPSGAPGGRGGPGGLGGPGGQPPTSRG